MHCFYIDNGTVKMKHYLPSFAFSWPLPFLFRWGAFWWLVMFSWCEIWLLFHQQSIRCINLFKTYQCTLNKYIPQKCLFFSFGYQELFIHVRYFAGHPPGVCASLIMLISHLIKIAILQVGGPKSQVWSPPRLTFFME